MTDVRAGIDAGNRTFLATFVRGDAKGMAGLHTATGCVMPAHSDIVSGAGNIAAFWQRILDMGVKDAELETIIARTSEVRLSRQVATR